MIAKALSEAEKMRRVPGVSFMDGPAGRRAHVDGTGLDVWEIVRDFIASGYSEAAALRGLDWITLAHLHTALRYYAAFPDEIDDRLRSEEEFTREWLKQYVAGRFD